MRIELKARDIQSRRDVIGETPAALSRASAERQATVIVEDTSRISLFFFLSCFSPSWFVRRRRTLETPPEISFYIFRVDHVFDRAANSFFLLIDKFICRVSRVTCARAPHRNAAWPCRDVTRVLRFWRPQRAYHIPAARNVMVRFSGIG